MNSRLPLQEAFDRLLVYFAPARACTMINKALHDNELRLWCDGYLLSLKYITSNLLVVIRQENDGRWCCEVEPAGARLGFDPSQPYTWEVDEEGIQKLLLLVQPRKRGRKSRANWTGIVDEEFRALHRKGSPLLENFEPLCAHLANLVERKTKKPPKDMKRFRQRIRSLLPGQN